MITITSLQPILDAFQIKPVWGVTELSIHLGKDRTLIHRYVAELMQRGLLTKQGLGAHTRYTLTHTTATPSVSRVSDVVFSYDQIQVLNQHFLKYSPTGQPLTGKEGFITWCQSKQLDPTQKITAFVSIAQHLERTKTPCGLLDVTATVRDRIEGSALDQIVYADQYNRMEFGRGKLAEMTFYAKDSQNIKLIHQCIMMVKDQVECFLHHHRVDAIAYTPHSRKRAVQLLKEMQRLIDHGTRPLIKLVKYAPYGTIVAQKSLKTREQRIQNAQQTILLEHPHDLKPYKTVLLIDDFVGSGATLNETAKKLRQAGAQRVIGFAFVGNGNLSYEVINEI